MISAELREQIKAAREAGKLAERSEPAARQARYNPLSRKLEIELRNGRRFSVSVDLIEGLQGASEEKLRQVEVTPAGTGLHWEALDVDVSVPFLLRGVYGTRAWMAQLGKRGGRVSSPAKAAAARENGRKGGRPRKSVRLQPREAPIPAMEDFMVRLHLPRMYYQQLQKCAREEGVTLETYLLTLVIQSASHPPLHLELQNVCQRLDRIEHQLSAWSWQIKTQAWAKPFNYAEVNFPGSVQTDFKKFTGGVA